MKVMKKLAALLLAGALAATAALPAFSADDVNGEQTQTTTTTAQANDSSVSVSQLQAGDVAHFYKIVEWVGAAEGNVKGWKVVSPFNFDLNAVLVGTPASEGAEAVAATGITADLANKLAGQVKDDTKSTDVTVGENETTASTSVDKTGAGIYMVLITPANPDVVYNPVFVSSDYNTKNDTNTWAITELASYSNEAAAKKSTTTLEKTASTVESAPDDVQWQTTAIGDTVSFTVTTTIPGFGEAFIDPFFKMTDQLTDLKLNAGSVTITSPADAAAGATITEAEDGLSYTIVFSADYLKTVKVPTKVTVTYSAKVTTDAPYNVNREKNEVWTEFSHDITNTEDHSFKRDTTQHYTFTIDADAIAGGEEAEGKKGSEIVKVGRDSEGKPINQTTHTSSITNTEKWEGPQADAHFKLYRDAKCENEYIPQNKDGSPAAALDYVTGEDGRMTIAGLDAGEYWLKEVSCPDGFVMDTHVAHIVITAKTTEKEVTDYTKDGIEWISAEAYNKLADQKGYKSYTYKTETLDDYTITIDNVQAAKYTFENQGNEAVIKWTETPPVELPHQFVNNEGVQLPSTGGMGTTLFYVIGGLLIVAAAIVIISKRRVQEG